MPRRSDSERLDIRLTKFDEYGDDIWEEKVQIDQAVDCLDLLRSIAKRAKVGEIDIYNSWPEKKQALLFDLVDGCDWESIHAQALPTVVRTSAVEMRKRMGAILGSTVEGVA